MSNHLKNWWQKRKTERYVKNNWHLFADVFLLLIILGLIVNIIILKNNKQIVDTTPIKHVPKITISTSTDYLLISTEIDKKNIYPNQGVFLTISLENKGSNQIDGLSMSPTFSNNSFSVAKIEDINKDSGIKIKDDKVIVERLSSGEKINIKLILSLNARKNHPRIVNWSLKTDYIDNNKVYSKNYNLDPLKIISSLKVLANAYYHSKQGDQLGSGPIPPIVGLPTNYWIFFELDNQDGDLDNLTVSAKLPNNVALTSSKTLNAGDFNYDESQKRITWKVKKIPAGGFTYQAGFEVQLLPTLNMINSNPLLLTNISYIATDSYTGEKLSGRLTDINTELLADDINSGQGKVLE